MKKRVINTWGWQEFLGFSPALAPSDINDPHEPVQEPETEKNSSQISINMNGRITGCFENLGTELEESGSSTEKRIRSNFYSGSAECFFKTYGNALYHRKEQSCNYYRELMNADEFSFTGIMLETENAESI